MTKIPHKHAAVIKAWADGATIESRKYDYEEWYLNESPHFLVSHQYRVKPEKVVDYTIVFSENNVPGASFRDSINDILNVYGNPDDVGGFLKRTRLDDKVVSFEFIPK